MPLRDLPEEEEEELPFGELEEKGEVMDDDEEEEGGDEDDNEVQVVTQPGPRANRLASGGLIPFDPVIHDVTGYGKADIIELRN